MLLREPLHRRKQPAVGNVDVAVDYGYQPSACSPDTDAPRSARQLTGVVQQPDAHLRVLVDETLNDATRTVRRLAIHDDDLIAIAGIILL